MNRKNTMIGGTFLALALFGAGTVQAEPWARDGRVVAVQAPAALASAPHDELLQAIDRGIDFTRHGILNGGLWALTYRDLARWSRANPDAAAWARNHPALAIQALCPRVVWAPRRRPAPRVVVVKPRRPQPKVVVANPRYPRRKVVVVEKRSDRRSTDRNPGRRG